MNTRDIMVAAKTVYGEARGELPLGKLAVAWVIRNRRESDKWFSRGTVAAVCLVPWQFSCWNTDDPNRDKLEHVTLDDDDLQLCLYAALGALRGMEADPTGGSTHYHTVGLTPAWSAGKTPVCTIGGHVFFNDVD